MYNNSSFNNYSMIYPTTCYDNEIWLIVNYDIYNIVNFAGVLTNIICIVVFVKLVYPSSNSNSTSSTTSNTNNNNNISNNQGNMFKYFLIKSICDFLILLLILPSVVVYRKNGTVINYIVLLWQKWILNYFVHVFELASTFFEIAASIDCFISVSGHFKQLMSKFMFHSIVLIIFMSSFIFYIPFIMTFKIMRYNNGSSGNYYTMEEVNSSEFWYYHLVIHNLLRDVFSLIVLMISNIFILVSLKKLTRRRLRLSVCESSVRGAINAERNKTQMIIFTSLIYLLHLPIFFKNFNLFNLQKHNCASDMTVLLLLISYSIPLFSYILFNKNFRRIFFNLFLKF
jgi:hypothetical protein